jgi:hypothetical protein
MHNTSTLRIGPFVLFFNFNLETQTTKGTGGDILILEEAAYVDSGFFYETVAPLLMMGKSISNS